MKIVGKHAFAAPRDVVWQAIIDPGTLARTLPGCEDMAPVGDNEFRGKLKMKVGPVQGVFEGGVQLLDLDPPNGYRLKMNGKGAPGFVNGSGSLRLEDADDGGTLLHYDLDAQVGGRIAAVGQRLLESSAKVLTRQGLQGLEGQLAARQEAAAAQAPAAGAGDRAADDDSAASPTGSADAVQAAPPTPHAEPPAAIRVDQFLVGMARELWPYLAGAALVALAGGAILIRGCS